MTGASDRAATLSRFKKQRFLIRLSEDAFRDEVIRPIFLRQGLKDGRDLCGPTEEGKDALFVAVDQLGMEDVYVVQTKRGSLNLAAKASQNLVAAVTQLRTALATRVLFTKSKTRKLPTKAILCASGTINQNARHYILENVPDPRIVFMDSDDLIPLIDEKLPEFWFGLDANSHQYLRLLRRNLADATDDIVIGAPSTGVQSLSAVTDEMFVSLTLHRTILKVVRRSGQAEREPSFEQLPITGLMSRREKLFLIIGDAGSGKSTSLRRLAYVMANRGLDTESEPIIPILLRSTDIWRQSRTSLVDLCAEETRLVTRRDVVSFSGADLTAGRLLILIDALDELAEDEGRRGVIRSILEFHRSYSNCKVVVTSRDYGFVKTIEELDPFTRYRLSPIDYKQAEKILKRIQSKKSLAPDTSKEILRRLQDVHGMELNPLLVTVFAATTDYSRRDIPANITELFKKFTEVMLGRWDSAKGLGQQYHAPLKDFLLQRIGLEMHRQMSTGLPLEEFGALLRKELTDRGHKADIPELLDEILNRSGLFRMIGTTVEFRHLLLQEFFAGRGLPADLLEGVIGEDWWQRAIVFYFGENPGDGDGLETIMRALAAKPKGEVFDSARTLGLALQACYLVEVKHKTEILAWVIKALADSKDTFIEDDGGTDRPLTRFVAYYLFGRDSVASTILEEKFGEIDRALDSDAGSTEERELRKFWAIVGLIEAGRLDKAEKLVKTFRPSDPRLLLAIHLGCFIIQHLRVSTRHEKEIASNISASLWTRVHHLRGALLTEFKSELLEIQRGEIKAVGDGSGDKDKR